MLLVVSSFVVFVGGGGLAGYVDFFPFLISVVFALVVNHISLSPHFHAVFLLLPLPPVVV